MESPIKIRFVITSDRVGVESLTEQLGILPSLSWSIGDPVYPRVSKKRDANGWVLVEVGNKGELIAEEIIDRIIEKLPSKKID